MCFLSEVYLQSHNMSIVLCFYPALILEGLFPPDQLCDYKLDPDWLTLDCNRFPSGRNPIISPVHHAD